MSVIAAPQPPTINMSGYDGPTSFAEKKEMAEFLAKAVATLPPVYRDRPADIFSMFFHAQALNVPVTVALHNLVWDEALGKGAMTAQLMGALLLRGGVSFTHQFGGDQICSMVFERSDGRPGGEVEWKITEAIAAGIAGSHTWQVYTKDMLFARCLSRGARRFAPDLILGFGYTIDELREISDKETADNDRRPEPDVVEFLAQVTDDTPASQIQALKKHAESKRIDLGGKYAGNGQTVSERLKTLWLAATAREMKASLGAADAAMAAAPATAVPGPATGSAAAPVTKVAPDVANAPAGEGDATCGCPNARLIAGDGHDPEKCRNQAGGESS